MTDRIDFGELDIEIPFSVKDEEYLLIEASGETAKRYQNKTVAGAKMVDGKVTTTFISAADAQFILLTGSIVTSEKRDFLKEELIRSWPHKITKRLFKEAKRISEINENDDLDSLVKQREELDERIAKIKENAAKNELENTMDGSD